MTTRILVALGACLLALVGFVPTSSIAGPAASSAAGAAARRSPAQLTFNFDNGESLRPRTHVRNVSGKGRGTVVVSHKGRLKPVRHAHGHAAMFPCIGCGRALIEVADRRSLDPRSHTFVFGASLWMTKRQGHRRANVVQKGYYSTPGGQYKLQVGFGHPACVVSGSAGRVIARATARVSNKKWHRVTCKRRPSSVVLRVDGVVKARASGDIGSVSNARPLRVGAKNVTNVHNNQFSGRLDDVFVHVYK